MNSSRRLGTSLVEVLVVIVVLLVGILAIVQVFPGGFRVLSQAQKNTIATALGRSMIELLKDHADQLPDAIVPVRYTYNGSQIVIDTEPDRFSTDLGTTYSDLGQDGNLRDSFSNVIGNWQFIIGSNIVRRVLGEGKPIPTPRMVGSEYGSLLALQFAPIVYNPAYKSLFVVYGNDMVKLAGDPTADNVTVRTPMYFVDQEEGPQAKIFLPHHPLKTLSYRIEFTAYVNDSGGGGQRRRDIVDYVQAVAPGDGPSVALANIVAPDTLLSVEYDSIRVARAFDDLSALPANDWGVDPGDPYSFKLRSPQLGLVLFNPAGYNYFVRRPGGRRDALIGRVSYDVYDWRIIHDEFRMPETYPAQYRLAVGGLKVSGEMGPDGASIQGIGVQSPDSLGVLKITDLVLEDTDSGGLFVFEEGTKDPAKTSFTVDKSIGLVTFLDRDNDATNGTQMMVLLPGAVVPTVVTVTGHSMRALYMGKNEWAVQVLKPAARYTESWNRPGIGQYYIGGSSTYGLSSTRIYFPPADSGRVVSLGEIYYTTPGGLAVGPVQLTAKLQTNNMGLEQLPYIQVTDYYPDFGAFDYSYGTAVKSVKGASVAVRVLWNPDMFRLSTDPAVNIDRLDKWMQGWRRSTVETYLQRGY